MIKSIFAAMLADFLPSFQHQVSCKMNLWTEYEGRTVAGAYTLDKLLRSEGRNAFFATSNGTGIPAVIRLTEAHFDQEEMLKRWRQVAQVQQDNLIAIKRVGETTFDGVALTYALLEPEDANLEDVLAERPLTSAETMQVAKSVVAALSALHASGLVHEHIEPANVLAVNETVKLRSDCVRECVADVEFNTPEGCAELRRRDIHNLGILLLRCLTLEREWTPALNLPEPFRQIIPRALDGNWSLEQIAAALDSAAAVPKAVAPPTPGGVAAPPRTVVPENVRQATSTAAAAPVKSEAASPEPAASPVFRARNHIEPAEPSPSPLRSVWLMCAAAAFVVLLVGWHFLAKKQSKPAATTAASSPVVPAARTAAPAASAVAAPTLPTTRPPAPPVAATPSRTGWYVVAFTYNHEGQARTKATRLGARHASLHPEVFSPTGRPPFLVILGGPMSKSEAQLVLRQARRSGMPRDTFIRNY